VATGINKQEKHGADAQLAARLHADQHPLPDTSSIVSLTYPGKLDDHSILESTPGSFLSVGRGGTFTPADAIKANSFVLADNYFGLHNLLSTGTKATLFYLDPPYGTGMDFHSRALVHAYKDDMCPAAYLEYMRRRLILMRECMTDDGSIYVHIGHQMVSHLKIIMDEIFGQKNFKNLIVRRKCSSKNFTQYQYPNLNDYILFYTKSQDYKWNKPGLKPDEAWLNKEYTKEDDRGRYKLVPVHAPGTRNGETGKSWRDMTPPPGKHWQYAPSKLEELDAKGEIHWSRTGNPRRKVYLTDDKMVPLTDYWDNFRDAHHQSIHITGYPTEKNLDMLKIIVAASSDEGDIVVDPFCGSGTTLHAAHDLSRKWIGFDQSFTAAKATINRLRNGLVPMGDYVSKKSKKKQPAANLFDGVEQEQASTSRIEGNTSAPTAKFQFLVDEWLQDEFSDELSEIGSI
jgi:adenine-specific DNA-methyltransferase